MSTTQKIADNEHLAKADTTVEALVREVSDLRAAERTSFFWLLAILLGIFLPLMIGLLVSLITLILTL